MKPASAPLSLPPRRGAAIAPKFGAIIYLISIALIAAVTVGVFFGLGFYLLAHRPATGAYSEARSGSIKAGSIPVDAARPAAAPVTALPAGPAASSSVRRAPAPGGTAASGIPDRPIASAAGSAAVTTPRTVSPDTSAPPPESKLSATPPKLAQATSPHLSATEIATLLAHGDADFRKGDIDAARLLYQRAYEVGEGRGALGMGATYDPAFLRLSPLRILFGDPVEARAWYLHALALGAAEAERRLINLQARAAR
jgi:hypothetical protein